MYSLNVNALLWYFINRSTLITFQFLIKAPLTWDGWTKDVMQVSHCEHARLPTEYMPMFISTSILFIFLSACCLVNYFMNYLIHAAPVFISPIPHAYGVLMLLSLQLLLLLFLHYYCYYFITTAVVLLLLLINYTK